MEAFFFSFGPFLHREYSIALLPIPKGYKNGNFVLVVEKPACDLFRGFDGSCSNYRPSQEFEGSIVCDSETLGGAFSVFVIL